MTDQERLDTIDWHRECAALLTAGLDVMRDPPEPVLEDELDHELLDELEE